MRKIAVVLIILLTGCYHHHHTRWTTVKLPPVKEGWQQSIVGRNAYTVQAKDTLYSIAWAFGIDYRDLAKRNNINPPYSLSAGTCLYITTCAYKINQQKTSNTIYNWFWPTSGVVVAKFNNKPNGNKGIDIKGKYNNSILASNSGQVVYSGTGIRSYGKLIIIKHNDDYLSAYAYNKNVLVHEGQSVKAGQKIATMGNDDAGNVCLHFEIRKIGKPVNPLLYLPTQK